jgi:hypothetical protein
VASLRDETLSPWAAPVVIAAIGVLACVVYLAAGRRDIGTSAFDVTLSPAIAPATQLAASSRDVPAATSPIARASIVVAKGRRTALRDLAAVSSAAAITLLGFCLRAAGVPVFAVALTMLAMMMGQSFWWRGVYWSSDALTPAIGRTVALTAEFTTLGLCLVTIGSIVLVANAGWRVLLVMIAAVALYIAGVTDLPVVMCGWAAVAIGLTWLLRALPARRSHAIVTVVAIALIAGPALTRTRLSALGRDLDSSLAARAAYDLRAADLPANAAMIAESRRVDATLRLSSIAIVPQTAEDLDAGLRDDKVLLAFANARANLEKIGFLFERAFIGNIPVAIVAGHTPCVDLVKHEWRDVSLLTAASSFTLHGATFDSAPGGVMLHITHPQIGQVTSIEPRSIVFELENAGDLTALHVPHTGRDDAVTVALESPPVSAVAKADDDHAVRMCAGALKTPLLLGRTATSSAQLRMNDHTPFVSGWHPIEADPDYFRWTGAPDAIVRVPIARGGDIRVTITATPASRPAQHPTIGLGVNGCRLATQPMQAGQGDYEWIAGKDCWRDGFNQIKISTSPLISPASLFATHDDRLLGARIGAIRLARVR